MKIKIIIVSVFFILFSSMFLSAQDGNLRINPEPGTFLQNQIVSLYCDDGYKILYSFGNNSGDPDIPYTEPFLLSALPSEERTYSLRVAILKDDMILQRIEYDYLIDRKPPKPPFINIPEGIYTRTVEVNLEAHSESQIVYSLGGSETSPLQVWRGEPVSLTGGVDGNSFYIISAYAVDPAGNKSRVENWSFTVRTPLIQESSFNILSPVTGNFANRQLLYIEESGYRWIRFTTNGADPVLTGTDYTGPVMLRSVGDITLKVAAMPLDGTELAENYQVEFKVRDQTLDKVPESGLYSSSIGMKITDQEGFYCFTDISPAYPDPAFPGDIRINSLPMGYRTVPLRILINGNDPLEYRYFYILDNRYPADPVIDSRYDSPLTTRTQITLNGSAFSSIYYTLDGTSPDLNSRLYSGPFMLNIPEGTSSGSLIIKARAFNKNGNISSETSRLFTYNRNIPESPIPEIIQENINSEALIRVIPPSAGMQILFEMSEDPEQLKNITKNSSLFSGDVLIDVPRGQDSTFYFTFASRDNSGNISESTDTMEVKIDRRSSTIPLIEYNEGFIYLYGPEKLYYNVINMDDGEDSAVDIAEGIEYIHPFQLQGNSSADTFLKVESWILNESELKGPSAERNIVIPGTAPATPVFFGVENGGVYSDKTVILYISPAGENEDIHYSYAIGDSPIPEMTADSPIAGENLFFAGNPGEVNKYHLVLRSRNKTTGRFSRAVQIEFSLDLQEPEIPMLLGAQDGISYKGEISLIVPDELEDRVFISFSYNGSPPGDPFGEEGSRLFRQKRFSIPEGLSRKIFYRIGTEDFAGNRRRDETLHWFIIDNTIPEVPDIIGFPDKGISSETVNLGLSEISRDLQVNYQVSYDGRIPEEVDELSPVFQSEGLTFEGTEGLRTPIILRYKVRNSAGTWGSNEEFVSFVIDRSSPITRGGVQVEFIEEAKKFVLSWNVESNQDLFFRISELNSDFLLLNEPVTLPFPETSNRLTVESYVIDMAGNTSPVRRDIINLPHIRDGELIGGEPDNGLTKNLVRLFKIESSGFLRYEISTNGELPDNVSEFSPMFPKSMDLDASAGEEVEYLLRVRSFPETPVSSGGVEQLIRFTIDKTKPAAPMIEGITNGEHYQEDLLITFPRGEDVYYSLQKGIREDNPGFPDFTRYSEPLVIESKEGTFDTFRIYAYSKNIAGNQSDIMEWEFYIDREIIYVSTAGDDLNGGTRSRPFKTLEKAVSYSDITGRNTLFMAAGEYELNDSVVVPDNLNIIGGFDDSSWERNNSHISSIRPGPYFPGGRPLFILAGDGIFQYIDINIGEDDVAAIIRQEGGSWEFRNTRISIHGGAIKSAIQILGGNFVFSNSELNGYAFSGDALMSLKSGNCVIKNSSLIRRDSGADSLLLTLEESADLRILGSRLYPGDGRSTMAIKSFNSSLWIDEESEIRPGAGSVDAIGVYSSESDVTIVNSSIGDGSETARIIQGIFCEDSEVIVQDSLFNLSGRVGTVGLQTNNSRFLFIGNVLKTEAGEFLYIFRSSGSSGRGINNYIHADETSDFKGISMTGGSISLFHNTMLFKGGSRINHGITAGRMQELNIINNIIISDTPGNSGTGIISESTIPRIQGNNIHGWETIYQIGHEQAPATVDELNVYDNHGTGGIYHGNIDENPEKSFTDRFSLTPHLRRNSSCINAGIDISLHRDLFSDWDKERRPNPGEGQRPESDIGADEYYP